MKRSLALYRIIPNLIFVLFLIKFLLLSFFVTPLWDVPDEIGHYSYARDIAYDLKIPSSQSAIIKSDLTEQIFLNDTISNRKNWIAIHPPLYHLFCAGVIKISERNSFSQEQKYKSPRIVSSLFGAILVFLLFKILMLIKQDEFLALAFASSVGMIPMVSNLASGTNHDIQLFALCSAAMYFLIKSQIKLADGIMYLILSGLCLSLACVTKVTAVAFGLIVSFLLPFYLRGSLLKRLYNTTLFTLTWLIAPAIWHIYKRIYLQDLFQDMGSLDNPDLYRYTFDLLGVANFLFSTDVIDQYLTNATGLFGWMGKGNSEVVLLSIDGTYLKVYQSAFIVLSSIFGVFLLKEFLNRTKVLIWENYAIFCFFLATCVTAILRYIYCQECDDILWLLIASIIFILTILAVLNFLFNGERVSFKLSGAWLCSVLFALIFVMRNYLFYEKSGEFIAIHGRYLFPIIPILLVCFYFTFGALNKKKGYFFISFMFVALAISEAAFYLNRAIPFFQQ